MRRVLRWVRRIALGLLALVVVAVVAAVILVHTDFGRNIVRRIVVARLDAAFVGGATIGKLEGSPFGKLVVRDLVINGPDGKPAIAVARTELDLALLPLVSHRAKLLSVVADGVTVVGTRDANGELSLGKLLKPNPPSTWSVAIPTIEVHHASVAIDLGERGWVHLDGMDIGASALMPHDGPLDARVSLRGAWRERAAAIGLELQLHKDGERITVPYLNARAGAATIAATGVRVQLSTEGLAPTFAGTVSVAASRIAAAQLAPDYALPGDVAVSVEAFPGERPWTQLIVNGAVGAEPLLVLASANLDAKRVRGLVATGAMDAYVLTRGAVRGHGEALIVFDAQAPRAGAPPDELPAMTMFAHVHANVHGYPDGMVALATMTSGERATVVMGAVASAARTQIAATIHRAHGVTTLESGTLRASTDDPRAASLGHAPVRGSLHVELTASGALHPDLDLAVRGTIDGKHLRAPGLTAGSLRVALDAAHLPHAPRGTLHVAVANLVRGTLALKVLTVDAANRADGRIAVAVRSQPKQAPWLVDADAIVTPPTKAGAVAIDLVHHHVRAGNGGEWTGSSGHVDITPTRIALRGFRSDNTGSVGTAGVAGASLAVSGDYVRAGRGAGDLSAKIDATHVALAAAGLDARGTVDAHASVARRGGAWTADVDTAAHGVAFGNAINTIDAALKVSLHGTALQLDASATGLGLGAAKVAVTTTAPRDPTAAAAWKRLGRDAVQSARVQLEAVRLARLAELAGLPDWQQIDGQLDGDVQLSPTTVAGRIELKGATAPQLAAAGPADLRIDVSQNAAGELTPSFTANLGGIARVDGDATLAAPAHLFDPEAWAALGPRALRGASVHADHVAIDPALLNRLGITTPVHGDLSVRLDVGEGASDAKLALDVLHLRGGPLISPVHLQLSATADAKGFAVEGSASRKRGNLVQLHGSLPVTLAQLRADPEILARAPLTAQLSLPQASAPDLLALFGRTEVIAGTLAGTIDVTGTVRAPLVHAQLAGAGLRVPPGPGGKPVKTVDQLALDATWDGHAATVKIDGTEPDGGKLHVAATGSPHDLGAATIAIEAVKFDLIPVLAFAPGPAGGAAGHLDAKLSVTGLTKDAKVAGELHLSDARIPVAPQVGTLHRAKLDIVIKEHEIAINGTGRLGGGDIKLDGAIAMDGLAPSGGKATLTLRKVTPIGAVQPQIDADVSATLAHKDNAWVADITVDHGKVVVKNTNGEALDPVGIPSDLYYTTGKGAKGGGGRGEPESAPLVLNITIHNTNVESDELRGLIHGKLAIKTDARAVSITGDIDATRGDVDLFGRRYTVERAGVHFDGPPDPMLDIRISHDFADVTTVTVVRGRPSHPILEMSSDPGTYTQGQLLGFLLGGEPGGDPNSSGREQAASAGASLVAGKLAGYVKGVLPINLDVLRYEAASATTSAAVLVGTWLSQSLFLAYRQHLEARPDENQGEGEVEYWLTHRTVIEATAGDRGYTGLDLLWRKRY